MPTVLIVDDDKHVRTLLETVIRQAPRLARHALEVVTAGDGEEGLAVFAAKRPAVVICDLLMPKMDGFRFCQALRQREDGKDTGLIATSGIYRDPTVLAKLRDDYRAVFFAKPYQTKDIAETVARFLEGTGGARGEPPAPAAREGAGRRSGSLDVVNAPSLLLDLHEKAASGMLELARGRVEKKIELLSGQPVQVASNQRHETLGQFLRSRRIVPEDVYREALRRAADEGEKLGEALVELGAVTPAQLTDHLAAQVQARIAAVLRWPDGDYVFSPAGEIPPGARSAALDMPTVVFLGLLDTSSTDDATQALTRSAGAILEWTARGRRLRAAADAVFGEATIATFDAATVVADILDASVADSLRTAAEALLLAGCMKARVCATAPRESRPPSPTLRLGALDRLAPPTPAVGAKRPAAGAAGDSLYDLLFGDDALGPGLAAPPGTIEPSGDAVPILQGSPGGPRCEESGLINVATFTSGRTLSAADATAVEEKRAVDAVAAEHVRIEGRDWYAVLGVARTAEPTAIQTAYAGRMETFSLKRYPSRTLGAVYGRLKEIHGAYEQARQILTDARRRAAYDRQLARTAGAPPTRRAVDAELAFDDGELALAAGKLDEAAARFAFAVDAFPDSADYEAALGWTLFLGGRVPVGAAKGPAPGATRAAGPGDAAAVHIAQALTIDPDHPAAHEYMGRLLAPSVERYEAATRHLERALESLPPRKEALATLRRLRIERGDVSALERQYRRLIQRMGTSDAAGLGRLWLELAQLYEAHLHDEASARTAYACATRLGVDDPALSRKLGPPAAGTAREKDALDGPRARWRGERTSAAPLLELLTAATARRLPDLAYITASVLVARGLADEVAGALHRRLRPRFLVRAHQALGEESWRGVRHPDDDPYISRLFELLAPFAEQIAPVRLSDLDAGDAEIVTPPLLPDPFGRVLDYAATTLGVDAPTIIRHPRLGTEVRVGALPTPVLLAGPAALDAEDRIALAFRLARAITGLRAGCIVGGSRPALVLKQLFLAAVSFVVPQLAVPDPEGTIERGKAWLAKLPADKRAEVRDVVSNITRHRASVNLSQWARALRRTGDRVGLLLCGDVAAACPAVADPVALDDLCDYALSDDHLAARAALGVSVDV